MEAIEELAEKLFDLPGYRSMQLNEIARELRRFLRIAQTAAWTIEEEAPRPLVAGRLRRRPESTQGKAAYISMELDKLIEAAKELEELAQRDATIDMG